MKIWGLIFFGALLRLWFSVTTGLGDDEAYYWDWLRQRDWSYYDHPPMTTWLIGISSFVWGDTQWGVRFFSWIFTTLSSVMVFLITKGLFHRRAGFWAVLFFTLIPIYSLGGILMVPDAPMMFFWLILLYLFLPENEKYWRKTGFWVLYGLVLGAGLLSKYTIVLLMVSVFFYLLSSPKNRSLLLKKSPWLGVLVSLICFLPVIIWNYSHGWPSFTFHFSERHQNLNFDWSRFGEFIASQAVFLTPFFFVIVLIVLWQSFKRRHEEAWRYIFWFSFPTLLLFIVQPLFSSFKPHWTAPGYIPLLCASGFWWSNFLDRRSSKRSRVILLGFFMLSLGLLPTLFYIQIKRPFIHRVYSIFKDSSSKKWNPRWDVTNDLYGWPSAGERARELYRELEEELGQGKVFLATHRYQLTGQLSFYSKIRAWSLGDKEDQYDFFLENLGGETLFLGKSAIILADNRYNKSPLKNMNFERCSKREELNFYRGNLLSHQFYFWKCYNFQKP